MSSFCETESSIFFYSNRDSKFGFMSNFYLSDFVVDGVTYSCMEKFIMKKKQELFDPHNKELSDKIMHCNHPSTIKQYGRMVENYDDTVWTEKRIKVAFDGLFAKFSQNSDLKAKLLATGIKMLYEASKSDKIWGIGFTAEEAQHISPRRYGSNILGQQLCNVRAALRSET